MDKVFVDTDIVLDLLAMRIPFYEAAAELFSLADKKAIRIYVSPLTFANVNYILSKQFSFDKARRKLLKFKTLVTVLTNDDKTIELALTSEFKDFEDGVQYFTAIMGGLKILLTRNLKDYKVSEISVMTAEQFLRSRK
jgi:predicted nucleic acid-binding protein